MDIKKLFGANLRKYRKERSLSQEELAEKAGVSVKHIGALESGSSFVSAELLQTFCSVLGVQPNLFFSDEKSLDLNGFPLHAVEQIVRGRLNQSASIISNEIKQKIMAYASWEKRPSDGDGNS
ncbi:MAG: helix-turn-helix transcriptional regulator [Treponema sp.]|nr:helix-turn-helix transcriptional regulator [Treponema sp.]